jgi:hypothetical protein
MSLSTLAWVILGISVITVTSAFAVKKTFHVETFIEAKPEVVWKALIDESRYSEWNTVMLPLDGEKLVQGKTVKYFMIDQNGKKSEIKTEVKTMIENKELNQVGGMPLILTFDHKYILKEVDGGTMLIQDEIDRGIGLWFWDSSWIEDAYATSANNLKKMIEENKSK